MTTKPDTTDNGQAALTEGELAALKRVDTFENIEGDMLDALKRKGLIVMGLRQIDVTVKGERVLAAQTASEPKPTTITAEQFVDDGYNTRLRRGDCFIYYEGDRIYGLYEVLVDIHGNTSYVFDFGTHEESGLVYLDADDKLDISWIEIPLPSAPVPVPEGVEVSDEVAAHRAEIAHLRSVLTVIRDYPTVETDMELGHQVAGMAMQAEVALEDDPPKSGLLSILLAKNEALKADNERLRARIAALEAERASAGLLVTALRFYADDKNWSPFHHDDHNDEYYSDLDIDGGHQATAALAVYAAANKESQS